MMSLQTVTELPVPISHTSIAGLTGLRQRRPHGRNCCQWELGRRQVGTNFKFNELGARGSGPMGSQWAAWALSGAASEVLTSPPGTLAGPQSPRLAHPRMWVKQRSLWREQRQPK